MALSKNQIQIKVMGHQIEGVLATGETPKPGQCVSIKSDGEYEKWNAAADGGFQERIVLMENNLVGKTPSDAYAAGEKFLGFIPCPGDEFFLLCASGETINIGTQIILDDGVGKGLATTGTPKLHQFISLEAGGTLAADTLLKVRAL